MRTKYVLQLPHAVYAGENALENISGILKKHNARRIAIFTDKGIEQA